MYRLIAYINLMIIRWFNNLMKIQIFPFNAQNSLFVDLQKQLSIINFKMISKFVKKIIGVQKSIKPFTYRDKSGVSMLIIYKGYQPHFQWFQQNHSIFKDNAKIYCYDRCSVDVALEMALRNTAKLSYISTRNYQTVKALPLTTAKIPKQQQSQKPIQSQKYRGMFGKSAAKRAQLANKSIINKQISANALEILKNYQFVIENMFLDIHPLQAYQKICGYLMVRPEPQILQYFQGFICTQQTLFQSFVTLPILYQLRGKVLQEQQPKISKIQRKKDLIISKQMIQEYINRWKDKVMFNTFANANNSFDQKEKIQWVFTKNLGQEVTKKDILNQKFRRYSYAIFN